MPPFGLIAGNGTFPFLVLKAARQMGHDVTIVAVEGEASPAIEQVARDLGGTSVNWIQLGKLGACIAAFKGAGVTEAVMAGQVKHVKLFTDVMPDLTMLSALSRLRSKNTDALISAIADVLLKHGITLKDSTAFLGDLLASTGPMTTAQPSAAMQADFHFGYSVADAIAGMDVGQTIVVKDRAVVAVEAMEGTDAILRRAHELTGGKPQLLVKSSRRRKHLLFDVPVLGPATMEVMRETNTVAATMDAGRTLLLDRDEMLEKANRYGISLTGIPVASD